MITNQIFWQRAYLLFGLGMAAIGSLTAILFNKLSKEKKSKIFGKQQVF
jgi:hypothetical protein